MKAIKLPIAIRVEFLSQSRTVRTREGNVAAEAGDALLTGVNGEQWPVPREEFLASYSPAAPTIAGEKGLYVKNPVEIDAIQLSQPTAITLRTGDTLSGMAGDWLITDANGDQWIVGSDIFSKSYAKKVE